MPAWKARSITPNFLPFGDNGRTYDPKLVVETQRVADLADLLADPLWRIAPLTNVGRTLVAEETVKASRARLPGEAEHLALVIRITGRHRPGLVVSASPERAALAKTDRWLIVTSRVVVTARGYEDRARASLADLLAGTTHRNGRPKPYKAPPVFQEDLDALADLAFF
ncbi:hypothetical protein [Methylobacterium sp. AMS5]|uniref:hypothetical protein n=1 Tax=Methylobacterium sp. AMS5 TaxID=925818 RepID=UPI00074FA2BF|nr:hypothetical protein [Methylobacterium sp. AMS5]AMB45082.1 hypothetical protein Y590_09240 [Methylobacterium sp. AMS5]